MVGKRPACLAVRLLLRTWLVWELKTVSSLLSRSATSPASGAGEGDTWARRRGRRAAGCIVSTTILSRGLTRHRTQVTHPLCRPGLIAKQAHLLPARLDTTADTFKFYLHFAGKIKNFHS